MSDYLKLTPKGLFEFNWNSEKKKYIGKKVKKNRIFLHLRDSCEIAKGTTLQNIFDIVDSYKLLKTFISQYSLCKDIEAFHKQAKETPQWEKDEEKIEYLEIKHTPNTSDYKSKTSYSTHVGFYGVGPTPDKITYSISYSPMYKLSHLPVKLNKNFIIKEPYNRKTHNKDNMPKNLVKATTDFSLLEILDGIYWDISFMGGPEENEKFIESMNDRLEAIKKEKFL
jgi:hypothetical protein